MNTDKINSNLLKFFFKNFDILIFILFIVFIILTFIFKNIWLLAISYIIAILGYSSTFLPSFKRKKEDERDAFLYFRANTYAFISTLIFIIIWSFINPFLPDSFNIKNLLSILLCFAISSYNFFYIFLKRKY